jgi:hypothetical protein
MQSRLRTAFCFASKEAIIREIKHLAIEAKIDRTLYILWRAIVFAAPVGALIWLSANIYVGQDSRA